jgi:hypothetical protein
MNPIPNDLSDAEFRALSTALLINTAQRQADELDEQERALRETTERIAELEDALAEDAEPMPFSNRPPPKDKPDYEFVWDPKASRAKNLLKLAGVLGVVGLAYIFRDQ